jgi:hypothetical protein
MEEHHVFADMAKAKPLQISQTPSHESSSTRMLCRFHHPLPFWLKVAGASVRWTTVVIMAAKKRKRANAKRPAKTPGRGNAKRRKRADDSATNTLTWNRAPVVTGAAYDLLRTTGLRPLQIGSHCSGWASEALALEDLGGIPHQHLFACDISRNVEILLRRCFNIGTFFRDFSHPESIDLAPTVDVYVNGWPCQPQSNMGRRLGPADSRSMVVDRMVEYLQRKLPRCFVLENVASTAEARHREWFEAILECLRTLRDPGTKQLAYRIFWRVCTSEDAGLPQMRRRIYIVGAPTKWYGLNHGKP